MPEAHLKLVILLLHPSPSQSPSISPPQVFFPVSPLALSSTSITEHVVSVLETVIIRSGVRQGASLQTWVRQVAHELRSTRFLHKYLIPGLPPFLLPLTVTIILCQIHA